MLGAVIAFPICLSLIFHKKSPLFFSYAAFTSSSITYATLSDPWRVCICPNCCFRYIADYFHEPPWMRGSNFLWLREMIMWSGEWRRSKTRDVSSSTTLASVAAANDLIWSLGLPSFPPPNLGHDPDKPITAERISIDLINLELSYERNREQLVQLLQALPSVDGNTPFERLHILKGNVTAPFIHFETHSSILNSSTPLGAESASFFDYSFFHPIFLI